MVKLLLALLLVACVASVQIAGVSGQSAETGVVVATGAPTLSSDFVWLVQRVIMKGEPAMGFYANRTIYAFPEYNILPGIHLASAAPTQIYFQIFDLVPMVRGKIDKTAFLVKVPPQPTLYMINPDQGTKWMMWNTSHCYQYGIDESKALIVNDEYLSRFPTEYIF